MTRASVAVRAIGIIACGVLSGCSGADSVDVSDSPEGTPAKGEPGSRDATNPATAANANADFGSNAPEVGIWVLPSPGGGAYSYALLANGHVVRGLPGGAGAVESPCTEEDLPAAYRGEAAGGATKCGAWKRTGDGVSIYWPGLPKTPESCSVSGTTMQCGDEQWLRGRSAAGLTLRGTYSLDAYVKGDYSPPGQTTTTHLSREITFEGDRLKASKWTGMTTTYDPLLTNKQGSDGVAKDSGEVTASYRFDSFTLETTFDDGSTDRGRGYAVVQDGAIIMLYVQGYGHLMPVE